MKDLIGFVKNFPFLGKFFLKRLFRVDLLRLRRIFLKAVARYCKRAVIMEIHVRLKR